MKRIYMLIGMLFMASLVQAQFSTAERKIVEYFYCISGNSYEEGYNEDEIITHYQEALKMGRFLVYERGLINHAIYNQVGKSHYKLNHLDSANYWYRKAYLLDTSNAVYISNMATITFTNRDYEEALFYFHKAHKMNPMAINYINNIVACYGSLGQYQDAITWSLLSLEIDAGSYNALTTYRSLITSYGALGDQKKVRKYTRKMNRLQFRREMISEGTEFTSRCPKPMKELLLFDLIK